MLVNTDALASLRAKRGLSQRELAARAEISFQGFQLIEHGVTQRPRIHTLRAIAAVLGVEVEDITLAEVGEADDDDSAGAA